jgi:pimeloyl-ACP methyl ester carboxylesterase
MPTAFSRMMGIPKAYRPSPQEAEAIAAARELLFPLRPRREGAVFDGFVSNLAADRFPFEQLTVPTLVISARDDALAPYRFAAEAARRIPTAKLVSVDDGSHFFMGRDVEGRAAIAEFVHELIRNVAQAPTVAFAGQSIHPMLMIRAVLTARMNRYQRLK